jgi:hypothetical protein
MSEVAKTEDLLVLWELSHIAEQHPTASIDIHGYDNQQLEISTVTINNNQRV